MSFSGLKCVGPFHMYHRPCSGNYKGHGHTGNEVSFPFAMNHGCHYNCLDFST